MKYQELKEALIARSRHNQIDLVGVAPVERFEHVHYRLRPQAHLPAARSVLVLGMRYPRAMYELAGRTAAESTMSLDSYENMHMVDELMVAAMDVTRDLEQAGFLAIPMQRTHYRVHAYKDIHEDWTQDFDHNVAAVAAGLGELGLHGVPITPEYGTRQLFIAVVTDAPLPADPMYDGPALCDHCLKCIGACPMNALDAEMCHEVVIDSRTFNVARKDRWRCMWSRRFMLNADAGPKLSGLDVTIDPPDGPISEADVQRALEEKGERGGLQTWYSYADRGCERMCIPPHKRAEPDLLTHQMDRAATESPADQLN